MRLRFLLTSLLIHAIFAALVLEMSGQHGWHEKPETMGVEILEHLMGPTLPVAVKKILHREHKALQEKEPSPEAASADAKASQAEPSRPSELAPSGEGATSGSRGDPYLTELIQLLEKNRVYPASSIRREEEGRVLLSVTVAADGALSDLHIQEASPFENLNRAALETLQKIARFPAPPDRFATPLHVRVPLVFRLERH